VTGGGRRKSKDATRISLFTKMDHPPGVVRRHVTVACGHGLYLPWWTVAASKVAGMQLRNNDQLKVA
jgi:hypothetical protein